MSTKAVIIWLLVALLLGLTAIVLLRPATPGSSSIVQTGKSTVLQPGARVFDFTGAQIARVSIKRSNGVTESIEPIAGKPGEWQLRLTPAAGTTVAPAPWPLATPQIQSMARIIAELTSVAAPASDAVVEPGGSTITITLADAREHTLRLASRTLAGTCLIEHLAPSPTGTGAAPSRTLGLVSSTIFDLFNNPGPKAWRDPFPLGQVAPEAARVTLKNAKQSIVLGKSEARWSLREPAAGAADQASVHRFLQALAKVRIVDFLDDGIGADTPTGLDSPTARVIVEVDTRSITKDQAEPVVRTRSIEIAVGAADSSGSTLFGSIGDRVVMLDARSLAELSMDPAAYLWAHPIRMNPADIGSVTLSRTDSDSSPLGRVYKRELDRWMRVSNGTHTPLVDRERSDLESLLVFLTGPDKPPPPTAPGAPPAGPPMPAISITAPPNAPQLARITLLSLGGDPLYTLDLGVIKPADPAAAAVFVRTGDVFRIYAARDVPWLVAELLGLSQGAPIAKPATP